MKTKLYKSHTTKRCTGCCYLGNSKHIPEIWGCKKLMLFTNSVDGPPLQICGGELYKARKY